MISICIPVFNIEVLPLVESLRSIKNGDNDLEIIIGDDASDEKYKKLNEGLHSLSDIRYYEREKNTGRSAIRNFLATKANNNFLLFIDADSAVVDDEFLQLYKEEIKSSKVICGGTIYGDKPMDDELMLRYVYGINREVRSIEERTKFPYRSFSAQNFCIEKELFLSQPFDEQIKSYGHEDTLLGLSLKKKGVKIKHIENPLIHTGLEPAFTFISKTNTGLENLIILVQRRPDLKEMAEEVRVLNMYFKMQKLGMRSVFALFFRSFKKKLLKNLSSSSPSLFYFDLYKLGYLCDRAKELKM